jgi:solute carrier family 7 (L-type amino acid transporter), member 5
LQTFFLFCKLIGLGVIIALGIYGLIVGRFENFEAPFENSVTNPGRLAIALYSGLYSFSGWSFLNYVVEEMKNPIKYISKTDGII